MMKIPSKKQAIAYNEYVKDCIRHTGAGDIYVDGYEKHSQYVAEAAKLIGQYYPALSIDTLEIFGLLHDVGKYLSEKANKTHHGISGYRLMKKDGFDSVARICITHSYPMKSFNGGSEELLFHNQDDIKFVKDFLNNTEYDKYDEIIQLADNIALHTGFVTVEDRIEDMKKRYCFLEELDVRKNIVLALKEKIEKEIGKSVYDIVGIKHNNARTT